MVGKAIHYFSTFCLLKHIPFHYLFQPVSDLFSPSLHKTLLNVVLQIFARVPTTWFVCSKYLLNKRMMSEQKVYFEW